MKFLIKKVAFVGVLICLMSGMIYGKKPKILHIGFHQGCLIDFEHVARELDLDVTSWCIPDKPLHHFDGQSNSFDVYNITQKKAETIWHLHKDYFDQFDIFMTSDTAPLSRIFLQNQTEKPVVVWICNRLDYNHEGLDSSFPDLGYYTLLNQAVTRVNVKIIPYTPYDYFYASIKGVMVGLNVIKPFGARENVKRVIMHGRSVPESVNKQETVFLYPSEMEPRYLASMRTSCDRRRIKTYCGKFSGPEDLKDFKGVVYIPYQMSNLILFEGLSHDMIFFVPSLSYRLELEGLGIDVIGNRIPNIIDSQTHCRWMEWYLPVYKDVIVYFDSWDDLKHKIETTDYQKMKRDIRLFSEQHRKKVLHQWQVVFDELYDYIDPR